MALACCAKSRDKDDEGDQPCILGNFWLRPNGAKAGPPASVGEEKSPEERSLETVQRHTKALGPDPNLLVYMVSETPPDVGRRTSREASGPQKHRAHHIPPNTLEGVPIETECFVGKTIVMYKPDGGFQHQHSCHPYHKYFSKRRRTWEVRVQGRFKRIPTGDMYIGIVLRDFNYDQAVAPHSMIVKKAGMALVKYDLYLSWGDRCQASKKLNAELSHLVTNMTAWDQIIVTQTGGRAPPLSGELHGVEGCGLNLERKEMGLSDYTKAIEEVCQNINTSDTYTMCFWGVSQVVDILRWNFKIGYSISMARFFEDDPIHVAMYELDPAHKEEDGQKHLECRKRYYLDFMFWSNSVQCPRLPQRYVFVDASEELERYSAAQCSGNGSALVNDCLPREESKEEEPSVSGGHHRASWSNLAAWTNKLKWIPDYTCSRHCSAPSTP